MTATGETAATQKRAEKRADRVTGSVRYFSSAILDNAILSWKYGVLCQRSLVHPFFFILA